MDQELIDLFDEDLGTYLADGSNLTCWNIQTGAYYTCVLNYGSKGT